MIGRVSRYLLFSVSGAFLSTVMLAGLLSAWATSISLRPLAVWAGRAATHRPVDVESVNISWDDAPVVELRGFHLPGPVWRTAPDMIAVDYLRAVIDWPAMRQGRMKFQKLEASGVTIYLERNARGAGNWVFDGVRPPAVETKGGGFAVIPANRTQFPTLLDAHLKDSAFFWRTSSGALLRLIAHDFVIGAPDDDKPTHILLEGAYNKAPAVLTAVGDSFNVMRDADIPFGIRLTIKTPHDRLDFDGTLLLPLDFDGVKGKVVIAAPSAQDMLDIADVSMPVQLASAIAGTLTKTADHWELSQSTARIADSTFKGLMILDEGRRGQPDALAFDLTTPRLSLTPILNGLNEKTAATDWHARSMVPDPKPGATVKGRMHAGQVIYRSYAVDDVALRFAFLPGHWSLDEISLRAAGGKLEVKGNLSSAGQNASVSLDVRATDLQAAQLFRLAGMAPQQIDGPIAFAANLSMQGRTLGDGVAQSRGAAIFTVRDGFIEEGLTELASLDLRRLFRKPDEMAPLPCLTAGIVVQNGIGRLAPLFVQAQNAVLRGVGIIDFRQEVMDILIDSDRSASGNLALDLPFRIEGPIGDPHIGLAINENAGDITRAANQEVPPELKELGLSTACSSE